MKKWQQEVIAHRRAKSRYDRARHRYESLLAQKDALFEITQPGAVRYDETPVAGSQVDVFQLYLERKEKLGLDDRLKEAKQLMDECRQQLELLEQELMTREEPHLRVYYLHDVAGLEVRLIARQMIYSRSQVYRLLQEIEQI